MKPSTKNLVNGKVHEVKGKGKEAAGMLTDDQQMQDEGTIEKAQGKVQQKIGQVQRVFEK